ncbi:putative aspartyl-tRNA synthetase protein [Rosellinia necatrix]|uniref:Putative aspartyl-tRNA synthetase protein n=1 Tax=Rosellinia necatrix TaxID=77044 RepID=A0A1S8A7X5_ROSNE|nr:putative aspartyl-tRNA synthetase protein [Rosellinia necatrix]
MAAKRTAEDEAQSRAPKNKRQKTTRIDPTSGQRGAFGDLEDATTAPAGDSDLDCEDDSEALAYLRSVRTQASAIPHVLVAKKAGPSPPPQHSEGNGEHGEYQHADRTIYEDGMGDFRGYYEDGAYVAAPDNRRAEEGEDDDERGTEEERDGSESGSDRPRNSSVDEIRDAYFTSITDRYIALRKRLQANPPQSVLDALPATNPTEVGAWKRGVNTFQKWESRLRETEPLPAQIAAMHKDSVFRLLRVLLACKFLRAKTQVRERTSRWVWALLARLPDKGELDYMEVGWIRELGKRAVLLMVTLAELEVLREHYDVAATRLAKMALSTPIIRPRQR